MAPVLKSLKFSDWSGCVMYIRVLQLLKHISSKQSANASQKVA